MISENKNVFSLDAKLNGAAHASKSERYQALSGADVVKTFEGAGLTLVHSKVSKAKLTDRQPFQAQLYRFRSGIEVFEGHNLDIMFRNNNLYGASVLTLGVFRGVCSNQLTVGTSIQSFKLRHDGDIYADTGAAILNSLEQLGTVKREIDGMLHTEAPYSLFLDLLAIRLGVNAVDGLFTIDGKQYSVKTKEHYRSSDASPDLWTQFNLAQERIMRGDVYLVGEDNKYTKLRRVNPLSNAAVELNSKLWSAAQSKLVA